MCWTLSACDIHLSLGSAQQSSLNLTLVDLPAAATSGLVSCHVPDPSAALHARLHRSDFTEGKVTAQHWMFSSH